MRPAAACGTCSPSSRCSRPRSGCSPPGSTTCSADYTAWRAQGPTDALETLRNRGLQDRTWRALSRGTWKPQLTDSQETFAEGSDAKVDNDWDSAFLTATYIADEFGEGALRALAVDITAGAGTDQALRTHLRMTQDQLSAKVRRYARTLAARA